jgi:hypothetical protein
MARMFGLCFGFPSGGTLVLGDAPLPAGVGRVSWTPLVQTPRHSFYGLNLLRIDAGDAAGAVAGGAGVAGRAPAQGLDGAAFRDVLGVDPAVYGWGYGAVLDSGSIMNYLPTPVYDALLGYLNRTLAARGKDMWKVGGCVGGRPRGGGCDGRRRAVPAALGVVALRRLPLLLIYTSPLLPSKTQKGGRLSDVCWFLSPDEPAGWAAADALFPRLRLVFESGASLLLGPRRYLFPAKRRFLSAGEFCLGFFDNGARARAPALTRHWQLASACISAAESHQVCAHFNITSSLLLSHPGQCNDQPPRRSRRHHHGRHLGARCIGDL